MDKIQLVCNLLFLGSMMITAAAKRRLVRTRFGALKVVQTDFQYIRPAIQPLNR
jgi:hypothetical protein